MNYRLNTGWNYPFAKTQEEWDAMTDRAAIIEGDERIAKEVLSHVVDWQGNSDMREAANIIFRAGRTLINDGARIYEAIAAVPPAPPSSDVQCQCGWCGASREASSRIASDALVREIALIFCGEGYAVTELAPIEPCERCLSKAKKVLALMPAPPSIPEREKEIDDIETAAFLRGQSSGKKYANMWQAQCATYEAEREKVLEALRLAYPRIRSDIGFIIGSEELCDKLESAIAALEGK